MNSFVNGVHTIEVNQVEDVDFDSLIKQNPNWNTIKPLVYNQELLMPYFRIDEYTVCLDQETNLVYFFSQTSSYGFVLKRFWNKDTRRRETEARRALGNCSEVIPVYQHELGYLMPAYIDRFKTDFQERIVEIAIKVTDKLNRSGHYLTDLKFDHFVYRKDDIRMVDLDCNSRLATFPSPEFRHKVPSRAIDVKWTIMVLILSFYVNVFPLRSKYCNRVLPDQLDYEWKDFGYHVLETATRLFVQAKQKTSDSILDVAEEVLEQAWSENELRYSS